MTAVKLLLGLLAASFLYGLLLFGAWHGNEGFCINQAGGEEMEGTERAGYSVTRYSVFPPRKVCYTSEGERGPSWPW
jgi:hypothetical protein